MKSLKFLLPILLLLVSGCKISKKNSKEEVITGQISIAELKHYKWFTKEYRNYNFRKTTVDSLSGLHNFKITVIGGEWCSDTKYQLPHFIKIMESTNYPEKNLQIIFVDRAKQKPEGVDNSFESWQIKLVPTIIVFDKSGKEKGRIVETPVKTLEEDLIKIINQL